MERRARVSEYQWAILLDFLEANPKLARARGYNNSARGRAESLRLWQEVSAQLNNERSGTTKSPKDWAVYVSNYKSKIRKLVADANATGEGPGTSLSPSELRFLAIIERAAEKELFTSQMNDRQNGKASHPPTQPLEIVYGDEDGRWESAPSPASTLPSPPQNNTSSSSASYKRKMSPDRDDYLGVIVEIMRNSQEMRRKQNSLDDVDHFFLSMSKMVKKLPKIDQIHIKMDLHKAIQEAELRQHNRETHEADQDIHFRIKDDP